MHARDSEREFGTSELRHTFGYETEFTQWTMRADIEDVMEGCQTRVDLTVHWTLKILPHTQRWPQTEGTFVTLLLTNPNSPEHPNDSPRPRPSYRHLRATYSSPVSLAGNPSRSYRNNHQAPQDSGSVSLLP